MSVYSVQAMVSACETREQRQIVLEMIDEMLAIMDESPVGWEEVPGDDD